MQEPCVCVELLSGGNLQASSAVFYAGKSKVGEVPDTLCAFFRCRWPNFRGVSVSVIEAETIRFSAPDENT